MQYNNKVKLKEWSKKAVFKKNLFYPCSAKEVRYRYKIRRYKTRNTSRYLEG